MTESTTLRKLACLCLLLATTALARGLSKRESQERLTAQGIEPQTYTRQQMAAFIIEELSRWARVVKTANIAVE